jgi:hypothetical protein
MMNKTRAYRRMTDEKVSRKRSESHARSQTSAPEHPGDSIAALPTRVYNYCITNEFMKLLVERGGVGIGAVGEATSNDKEQPEPGGGCLPVFMKWR